MKFMFLNLMVSFLITLWSSFDTVSIGSQKNISKSFIISTYGIIVMEDEVMLRTDTQDTDDPTLKVEVFSSQGIRLFSVTDCLNQVCYTDLSSLSPNEYQVVLTTKKGNTYTATVIVESTN